ncbi:MAG: glycosyl hydrolase [Bacteroidetes bacterium]|nr:glycosyl hydrolase [Bacteroidota bacterium]
MRSLATLALLAVCVSVASAQSTITSATFGMMEARHLGPGTMSGRITAITGIDSMPRTIYVGTAGGGVWKTTTGGAAFEPVFDKYCQSIGAIAVDQKHTDVVYVGTGESNMRNSVSIGVGLYKTSDGGDNWKLIGLDSTEHIAKIVIDPKNSDVIYVAAPGPLWGDSKHRGLYKSTDAGATWNKILYINEKSGCADVAVDPTNPNIVYASTWEFRRLPYAFNSGGNGSGMYKSTDAGAHWTELTSGLPPKPFGRIAFALSPSAPRDLVAIVESNETGLYLSRDGGNTWVKKSATFNVTARPFYFSTIMFDPKDSNRVYRPAFSFSYSNDGGFSFADAGASGGWVHSDMHALWINPMDPNQLYLGTDGGMYYSHDKGANWIFVQNLPVGQFYHVAVDNQDPYRIYGGLQDNGTWMAPSAAPGGIGNSNWMNLYGGDGFWAQPDLTDPDVAYAESQGGNAGRVQLSVGKSYDIQPQAGPKDDKLRWNWNTPIVTGAKNPKHLYMGAQYLYRSTDQGRNWTKLSPDLTTNDKKKQQQDSSGGLSADNTSAENHCTIFTIAESPLDENMIWVGTDDGCLQRTTDGGKTWTLLSKNVAACGVPSMTWVSSIEPSHFDKNVVYATFDNHYYGDMQTYVAKSTDMGSTWMRLTSPEFTGFAHKIAEDLVNRQLLFVGTEMGFFSSLDGGATWIRMKNNVPWYALTRDIKIHPKTNDLLLATHGRGIISIDDITPMRELTNEIASKAVYLFPMQPVALSEGRYGGGGFPSTGGWSSGNAAYTYAPPIEYYLKDRISSGDVKLGIYNADGTLVQELTPSKRKGINKVSWNLRMTPPKVASGGSKPDYSGFYAPMVLPGSYTAKLTVGSNSYSLPITLVHDAANTQYSTDDEQVQYKTAMAIYHLHESLAAIVDSISAREKTILVHKESQQDPAAKQLLSAYHDSLEALRATLLATKQKSIFADEKQLREEISELYTSVVGNQVRPSNLQIERVAVLSDRVAKAKKDAEAIDTRFAQKAAPYLGKL